MSQVVHNNGCRFQKIRIFKDQEIGRGAYGMVCKAECDGLLCAAKLLHPLLTCDWTVQSFHNECQILSSIKHPNIIQYLGTHEEGPGNPVLLMELLDTSLTALLEESPSSPPLPFHTEVNLCHDVSLALAYLHSNDIIHRDLSSNNVLLTKERKAKVTDFGMCKLMGGDQHVSRLTQVPGCAAYMPPEAQMDRPTYTYKLDSFSYGVLTVQMLTRKFPAPGPPRKRINDPRYGLHPIEVPIPEPERRKSHIDLIDPSHPLLKVALVCLSYDEKDRPSSSEICSQVEEMKRSERYREGVLQEVKGGATEELHRQFSSRDVELLQLREQLESSEREKKMLKERIDELTSQLDVAQKESQSLPGGVSCGRETTDELRRTLSNKSKGSVADIWKADLLCRLQVRTNRETSPFKALFGAYARLQEQLDEQKKIINRLEYEKGQIERVFDSTEKDDHRSLSKQDKRDVLQKELMEAFRKKSELADKVLELTEVVRKKDGELNQAFSKVKETEAQNCTLKTEKTSAEEKLEIERITSRTVQEQHRALQLQYLTQADRLKELERLCGALKKELQQSLLKGKGGGGGGGGGGGAEEFKSSEEQPSTVCDSPPPPYQLSSSSATPSSSLSSSLKEADLILKGLSIIPTSNIHQFDAHESDVSALCFSPDGTCLATGGSDKVVKVWTLRPDMRDKRGGKGLLPRHLTHIMKEKGVEPKATVLSGNKAGIMSVQFDPTSKMVVTASNDSARLWLLDDQKCKHTLEGHSGKVLAARFLADDSRKLVTGSHDRTLKIWDLQRGSCVKTMFAGSSCNDVVTTKRALVISGHTDKKIRFWDLRSTGPNEILLDGKITSLDHYPERQLLLCCSQDDTLRLIDLRQNSISASFSAPGFKVGAEWTRACFSPDGQYVAAGSADGSVFVWEVASGRMKSKKEHMGSSVVVCGWHPSGQLFASGDSKKKIILWKR